jgi:hypothetical protein
VAGSAGSGSALHTEGEVSSCLDDKRVAVAIRTLARKAPAESQFAVEAAQEVVLVLHDELGPAQRAIGGELFPGRPDRARISRPTSGSLARKSDSVQPAQS